jgi:bifunctional non-homologous end joining protein LigD
MKALGSDAVPTGSWQCEVKFDGFRAVAVLNGAKVELWSRNRNSLSAGFPEIAAELGRLRCRNAVLDGEIVALDEEGRSRFQLLQNREDGRSESPLVYFVFDIMHRDGTSLLQLPLAGRRKILEELMRRPSPHVQLSPSFHIDPAALFEVARSKGLEGIVVKKPDSPYEPGRRSGAWLKCKVLAEQEFVVGGFTRPRNSREHFGAILVGYHEGRRLLYAGKVGTGFSAKQLSSLHGTFSAKRTATCPFDNLPMERRPRHGTGMTRSEMGSVTWLRPTLVAQIKFAEWTDEGLLRQPVFLGLRDDKAAAGVRREAGPIGRRKPRQARLN